MASKRCSMDGVVLTLRQCREWRWEVRESECEECWWLDSILCMKDPCVMTIENENEDKGRDGGEGMRSEDMGVCD